MERLASFVAECFWPDVREEDVRALDERIAACLVDGVRYLGSLLTGSRSSGCSKPRSLHHPPREESPMRRTLFVALVAAALVAPAAVARPAFTGNVCSLLNARQVAAMHVPSKCTHNSSTGSASTLYSGSWGTATGPHLSINVNSFQSTRSSAFQLGKKYLGQIPNAKSVSGVGTVAWASRQGNATMINFVVGHDTCQLGLITAKPLTSVAPAIALAKAIAAKL